MMRFFRDQFNEMHAPIRHTLEKHRANGYRSGVATIEFVMCFPILAFLAAMIFFAYQSAVLRSQTVMEVRHRAWMERPNLSAAKNNAPFGLASASRSGEVESGLTRKINSYRQWYPTVSRTVSARSFVLTGSWDHRQVDFAEGILIYPHLSVLRQMVTSSDGPGGNEGSVDQLHGLTQIPGL